VVRICHSLRLPKVSNDVVAARVSATWGNQGIKQCSNGSLKKGDQAVIEGYGSLED
jgi:hypothetical protein